ncbi:MAG: plasmid stabilization protein [Aeromicrobium sp.]|uniref:FitA-like ribbon-helix-helix domain-containing protein n=1 Tax=Aeromicrobium sp. TaxID=1871063 RepID=UPI0039E53CAE
MATITVRHLDDEVRARLRIRAAGRGHSMEAEVRAILTAAVAGEGRPRGRNALMDLYWESRSGMEVDLPVRSVEAPRVDFAEEAFG